MHNFHKLNIWKDAMALAVKIYEITDHFPKDERYNLIQQVRKCAVSVPSNIAEGAGRNTNGEFRQFLGYAMGSLYEMETQIILSGKLGFWKETETPELIEDIRLLQRRMYSFKSKL